MDKKDNALSAIEKTHKYLEVQLVDKAIKQARLTHGMVDEIIEFLKPGIRESEVKEYALDCFKRYNIERVWHQPYIRFGTNTLLTFMDKAQDDLVLGENDIAYIDIGIVKDGIEGDAGKTVAFGSDPIFNKLAKASETIFVKASDFWRGENPNGIVLYEYIHEITREMELEFNLDLAGHLIGAFPHKGWKKGINNFPEQIEAGKWILEIQIRHPDKPYGAFYEDLLY